MRPCNLDERDPLDAGADAELTRRLFGNNEFSPRALDGDLRAELRRHFGIETRASSQLLLSRKSLPGRFYGWGAVHVERVALKRSILRQLPMLGCANEFGRYRC